MRNKDNSDIISEIAKNTETIFRIGNVEVKLPVTNDIIAIVDLSFVIKWINISVLFYTGSDDKFFFNKKLSALLFNDDTVKVKNLIKLLTENNDKNQEIMLRLKKNTGNEYWFDTTIFPLKNYSNVVIAYQFVFHNVTDIVKAEENREIERTKVMKALIEGQEMERKRISMELHDGLGQKMTGIKMKLENSSQLNLEKTRELITEIKDEFRQIIDELRTISANLSPATILHWGLINSLSALCGQFEKNSGISFDFSVDGNFDNVSEQKSFCIYRIVQEGLNNIAKHSKAINGKLFLIEKEKNLLILIEDDGIGINMQQLDKMNGNGLKNIRQRVALLGGTVNFGNIKNSGTIIFVRLPK